MITEFISYLQYPFVTYALIVGVMIALCSSLFGVTLVLKRFSFIGDGLSHVAFGALAIAAVMKLANQMVLILPVTAISAILLLRSGGKAKIKGDAALAMISVSALAIGYLLMNVFSTSSNLSGDVCTTLFGSTSILTLGEGEVAMCLALSMIVIIAFVFMYNKLFTITFDEDFAAATGMKTNTYNLIIAIIISIIIVVAMSLVGALLISALVVFPALSAMRLSCNYRTVTLIAAVFSIVCTFIGMAVSIMAGTPVGATIVAMQMTGFFICYITEKIRT